MTDSELEEKDKKTKGKEGDEPDIEEADRQKRFSKHWLPRFMKRLKSEGDSPARSTALEPEPAPSLSTEAERSIQQAPSDPPLPEVLWHGIRLVQHKPKRHAEVVSSAFDERGAIDHRTLDGNPPVRVQE